MRPIVSRVTHSADVDGGCDFRYRASSCAWGARPDRVLSRLIDLLPLPGATVLDAGCGEGRNAVALAERGARVHAVEISAEAIGNRPPHWRDHAGVRWEQADITTMSLPEGGYDGVLLCSVLHWLVDAEQVMAVLRASRNAVRAGGLHTIVVFNDRLPYPDTGAARPPALLPHDWYTAAYRGWDLLLQSDSTSTHIHPGESEPHSHGITRIIARRPRNSSLSA
jgi:SAM-dependent methyltransferase